VGKDRFVSVHAAARRLGCSPATVRRWIHEGLLDAFQPAPGKQFRIPLASLDDFVVRTAADALA